MSAALLGVAEDLVAVPSSDGEAVQMSRTANRFVVGMDEVLYHSGPEISASGLKVVAKSPKAYQASRGVRVQKKAFDVGHAVHGIVLGVGLDVREIPDEYLDDRGYATKKVAKDFIKNAEAAGAVALKSGEYRKVRAQCDAVLMNPKARRLLEVPGLSELSMFATDPETGLRMRGRIDRAHRDPETGELVIVDLKTSSKGLALHGLSAEVDRYGYDLSMEVYRFLVQLITGEDAAPTVLIFTETEPPYDVRTVRLGESWMQGGWMKFRSALARYAEALDSGAWPGVDDEDGEVPFLDPPGWYEKRALEVGGEEF